MESSSDEVVASEKIQLTVSTTYALLLLANGLSCFTICVRGHPVKQNRTTSWQRYYGTIFAKMAQKIAFIRYYEVGNSANADINLAQMMLEGDAHLAQDVILVIEKTALAE